MPMISIEQVVLKQAEKGNSVCFECTYVGHGVTWLGCGTTHEEAIQDLVRAISHYFTPYDHS